MKKIWMKALLMGLFFTSTQFVFAQLPTIPQVSSMDINALSDAQFQAYLQQAQLSGLSEAELEAKAKQRGLSDAQIAQIKARMGSMGAGATGAQKTSGASYESRKPFSGKNEFKKEEKEGLQIFGSEFFSNANLTFEPNMRTATPSNYVLGVDDELSIDIYGFSEKTSKYKINTEGQIRIPNIGPVVLAGLTVDEAKTKLRNVMAKTYPGLKTGNTFLQVSLGQIRSIRVTLIGEVKQPGTYELSSLATLANALYASGGPSTNGSFRKIDLIRNGKKIVTFDLYDFLLNGDLTKNVLLKDDDIIKVHPYAVRLFVNGAVKRPAIYESEQGENLATVIEKYAAGFADSANKNRITIQRFGDLGKSILNVEYNQLNQFAIKSSDSVVVGAIPKRFENRVIAGGAVFYPNSYAVSSYPTLGALLKAAQLKENAFKSRALLFRTNPSKDTTVTAVNLESATDLALALRNDDSLHVYSKAELRESRTVTITGELNKPGDFSYSEGMKIEDLILLAGGLKDRASLKEVEVLRRIRKDQTLSDTAVYNTIFRFNLTDSLTLTNKQATIELEPFDVVNVKNLPRNQAAGSVSISGEVLFPGTYLLNTKKDRVSDLFKRAGGILESGSLGSAFFLRNTYQEALKGEVLEIKKALSKQLSTDTLTKKFLDSSLTREKVLLSVNLRNAIENPGSEDDIYLEEGDVITIPKTPTSVQAFGGVNIQKKVPYFRGLSSRRLIRESGGFSENANKKGTYVLYPNGKIKTVHNYVFFKTYPRLTAGAELYVPVRKNKKPLTTAEILGLTSSLVGMGAIIIGILNATK
ncbi:SLBB domain-containing protein [Sediminibacterium sp. TEGAF015]|uniref:SLBB domain-containing protein n=1 Tax=Sediminibacterium sp. TEGAF015 TaxID=575378 RepID=UPI00220C49F4|nr:SLBB domain-containing protein [Sediminibacterium sp. TEGAF015]BDQ13318.1 capsule polysaccharide transporter [Sediminibacterium sp. TEGAF015]